MILGNDAGARLCRNTIQVADLLAAVKTQPEERRCSLLQQALALDERLHLWPDSVPPHWRYSRTLDLTWHEACAYRGSVHVYYDVYVASVWNSYRRLRIPLLSSIIWLATARETEDCQNIVVEATKTINVLAEEICAAVPFHIGTWTVDTPESAIHYPSLEHEDASLIHRQNAYAAGPFLIFPSLAKLKALDCLKNDLAKWADIQYSRVCSRISSRHHVSAYLAERFFSETFPAFAYGHPINLRNLA